MNIRRIRSISNIPYGVEFQPQKAFDNYRNPAYNAEHNVTTIPAGDYIRLNMPNITIGKRSYLPVTCTHCSDVYYLSLHSRGSVVE